MNKQLVILEIDKNAYINCNGMPRVLSPEVFNRVMADWSKESVAQCVSGLHGGIINITLPYDYLMSELEKE